MPGCNANTDGRTRQRRQRRDRESADHGAAEGGGLLAAFAETERHRHHAGDHREARHQDRPQPAARAFDGGLAAALAAGDRGSRSAKVTSRIAFATATPTAMIAPMKDWMLSVVPRQPQAPARRRRSPPGTVETTTSESRSDWKFAASSRKIDDDRQQQAGAQAVEHLLHRHDLAAHGDAHPRRRVAERRDSAARPAWPRVPRSSPAMLAVRVTMRCML